MYQHFWAQMTVVQDGDEMLPRCDLYGMQMPEGRLVRHPQAQICNKKTQIRWQRRDVDITSR